ncbi:MAG: helix-turn-helix domain-containing protein [Lentisphaeria bacterium]|nr:helix-turn-helix domain-containing protein [Lentisphaeria bacterium]
MYIFTMLAKNSFKDTPDFPLRGFNLEQLDTKPHIHEFSEIVFVRSGSGLYWATGKMKMIGRGDILILPSNGCHGYYKTDNLKIFNMLFLLDKLPLPHLKLFSNPSFMYLFTTPHEFFENKGHYPCIHPKENKFAEIETLLDKIEEVYQSRTTARDSMLLGYFLALISIVCDIWENQKVHEPIYSSGDIVYAISFLNKNYMNNIYLEDIAKACSMSPNSLLRNFKKVTGCTPLEYLTQLRISQACFLLINSSMRGKEIAEKCGFTDFAYFIRIFRKKIGCTPRQYKAQNKNKKEIRLNTGTD